MGGTLCHLHILELLPEQWGAPTSGGLGLELSGDLFLFLSDDWLKWKERGAVSSLTPLHPLKATRLCAHPVSSLLKAHTFYHVSLALFTCAFGWCLLLVLLLLFYWPISVLTAIATRTKAEAMSYAFFGYHLYLILLLDTEKVMIFLKKNKTADYNNRGDGGRRREIFQKEDNRREKQETKKQTNKKKQRQSRVMAAIRKFIRIILHLDFDRMCLFSFSLWFFFVFCFCFVFFVFCFFAISFFHLLNLLLIWKDSWLLKNL